MCLRRSKLEMYLDILRVLAVTGPLKLTHIMYKANVNCSVLKQYLDFMIKQELIAGKLTSKKRLVYEITPRGMKVLENFSALRGTIIPTIIIRKSKQSEVGH